MTSIYRVADAFDVHRSINDQVLDYTKKYTLPNRLREHYLEVHGFMHQLIVDRMNMLQRRGIESINEELHFWKKLEKVQKV